MRLLSQVGWGLPHLFIHRNLLCSLSWYVRNCSLDRRILLLHICDMLTKATLQHSVPIHVWPDYNECNQHGAVGHFHHVSDVPKIAAARCKLHLCVLVMMKLVCVARSISNMPCWIGLLSKTSVSNNQHHLREVSRCNANARTKDKKQRYRRAAVILFLRWLLLDNDEQFLYGITLCVCMWPG